MNLLEQFEKNYDILVVCGPTACGKTSLGVKLADKFQGEIISADSRQVYKGMDLGTGKDLHEYVNEKGENIKYHLIDIVSPEVKYSLYNYIDDFFKVYNDIKGRQKIPLLVGGTGLYIEGVLRNYKVANVPEDEKLRNELLLISRQELDRMLKELSIDIYNKTDLKSKKRIIRSIEIARFYNNNPGDNGKAYPLLKPLILAVTWPREEVISRIDQRFDERLFMGMVDEVRHLVESGVSRERMMMFGMEYKYIAMFVMGEISYNEMADKLKISIHRLAKRQMTWFRGMERRGLKVNWVDRADYNSAMEIIKQSLEGNINEK